MLGINLLVWIITKITSFTFTQWAFFRLIWNWFVHIIMNRLVVGLLDVSCLFEESNIKYEPEYWGHFFFTFKGMKLMPNKFVNVYHADFDDIKKKLLDNECHHKKRGRMWIMQVLMMSKRIHLIMIVVIKKGENVNVWIHDFDDAKEESNKIASKENHCFKINTRLLQQTKPCFKIN